jgi:hypothetical protein
MLKTDPDLHNDKLISDTLREKQQNAKKARRDIARSRVRAIEVGDETTDEDYELYEISKAIEESIPLWLERLLGVVGAIMLIWLFFRLKTVPVMTSTGVDWPIAIASGVFGAVGYVFASRVPVLLVRLFDLFLKFLRSVLILAAIFGGLWLLAVLFSS